MNLHETTNPGAFVNAQVPLSLSKQSIQVRFERFHAQNPNVYAEFRRLAEILLRKYQAGRIKWVSAKHIFERMRADYYFSDQTSGEPFKLSNDFTSRYARQLIQDDPRFVNVFRLRELETP